MTTSMYQSSSHVISLQDQDAQLVPTVGDIEKFEDHLREQCRSLIDDNQELRAEKGALKEKVLSLEITEQSFKDNDEKIKFYTGLTNWSLFALVFQFVQPFLNVHGRSSLSAFQQLIMTLMRLRLGLRGQDLAYRFGVHSSTVSRLFRNVIDVLYTRLKHLIVWPSRDVLHKTMPMSFRRHCPNCTVIIDCF